MYIYNNNDCMQNKGAQFNERRSEKQDDDGAAVSIRVREEHMRYINQWNAYQRYQPPYDVTPQEQHLYKENNVDAAMTYWMRRYHRTTHDELSVIAMAILSVNPSEASVERSFSQQKFIHTPLRNRLHKETVEALMFIKVNAIALGVVDDDVDVSMDTESVFESTTEM